MPTQGFISNLQQIELTVAGPDDVNRMYITIGEMQCHVRARDDTASGSGRSEEKTYSALIDPALPAGSFRRAIVIVSTIETNFWVKAAAPPSFFQFFIKDAEANYDDENSKVELLVTPKVHARGTNNETVIQRVSFQVTTLASIPQT
jgi:hypothetical protein